MIPINNIASEYGKEQAAALLVCRIYVGTATYAQLQEFVSEHRPDWEKVYRVIELNKLRPIAHQVLVKVDIPENISKQLKEYATMNAVTSMMSMNEVAAISNKLTKVGLNVLPYKGVMFSAAYYDNYSSREFSDLDFLIHLRDGDDLQIAKQVFDEEGYEAMHDNPSAIKDVLIENTCEFYFNKYEHGERKFHADFHWLAHHPVFDLPLTISNKALFQGSASATLSGREIRTLNDNHHFIAIMLHHGVKEGCKTVKYLLDFAQIIKEGNLDWGYLFSMSDKHKYTKVQRACLQATDELLGINANIDYTPHQNISSYKELLFQREPRNKSLWQKQLRKLHWADDNASRLKMMYQAIVYSFKPSVLDYKFLPLPKPLHILYIFVKLVRMILPSEKDKG